MCSIHHHDLQESTFCLGGQRQRGVSSVLFPAFMGCLCPVAEVPVFAHGPVAMLWSSKMSSRPRSNYTPLVLDRLASCEYLQSRSEAVCVLTFVLSSPHGFTLIPCAALEDFFSRLCAQHLAVNSEELGIYNLFSLPVAFSACGLSHFLFSYALYVNLRCPESDS